MGRLLGVDLGTRRIGLAVSDTTGTLASPLSILERGADHHVDHTSLVAIARDEEAEGIVVGLPRSLSGDDGPAARSARDEVEELRRVAGDDLPVELHDERFTTVTAARRLHESRGGRSKREPVDAAAAAEMLQSYLDAVDAGRRARRNR